MQTMISLGWNFNTFHTLLLLLVYVLLKLTSLYICHHVCALQWPNILRSPAATNWTLHQGVRGSSCISMHISRQKMEDITHAAVVMKLDEPVISVSLKQKTQHHIKTDASGGNSCALWWLICMQIRLLKIYSIAIHVSALQQIFIPLSELLQKVSRNVQELRIVATMYFWNMTVGQ